LPFEGMRVVWYHEGILMVQGGKRCRLMILMKSPIEDILSSLEGRVGAGTLMVLEWGESQLV